MTRIDGQLATLETMLPAELQDAWARVHGTQAPRLSPALLRHGIGYRLQELAEKPLPASALRQLRRESKTGPKLSSVTVALRAGTQLVRTWHGRTISVSVEDDGFSYEGRRYASLTSIAREVTGAGWSGPRFFGLTGRVAA